MKPSRPILLSFEIDKLTNSIENVVTGDVFQTDVMLATTVDIKLATKKNGWLFDWKDEFKKPERDVFKLSIVNNSAIVQGLMSVEVKADHVAMHLLESAPFNLGKGKVYAGVAGNLVAYACKLAFQRGHEGNVAFVSKTKLIDHYIKTLGAFHFGGHLMVLDSVAALHLIGKYFKEFRP